MQAKGKKIYALNLRVGSLSACNTETQELAHARISSVPVKQWAHVRGHESTRSSFIEMGLLRNQACYSHLETHRGFEQIY